jgi:hypothetical protein
LTPFQERRISRGEHMNRRGELVKTLSTSATDDPASNVKPGDVLHVNVQLQGPDEIGPFLRFKKAQFLRNNSEAGRKLMLERLSQIEAEKATQAPATL